MRPVRPAWRPLAAKERARLLAVVAAAAVAAASGGCAEHADQASWPSASSASVALASWSIGEATGTSSGTPLDVILSKLLSLGVVAGALVGKLPQVHAILKAHSAAGISAVSIWMEAVSLGIQFAYNVVRETPLTTYAEVPILFIQIHLLAITAAWADGYLGARVWAGSGGLVACTFALAARLVPPVVTAALYAANALLGLIIIGPQVVMTCRNRSTGQLSFVVAAMTFSGLTTRLYTTLVEVDDIALRLTVCLNWTLMAVMLSQFFLFRPDAKLPDEPEDFEDGLGESLLNSDGPAIVSMPTMKRSKSSQSSLLYCASQVGSSRCLYLLGDEALEEPMAQGFQKLRNKSWDTFRPPVERLRRSFNSLQNFQNVL